MNAVKSPPKDEAQENARGTGEKQGSHIELMSTAQLISLPNKPQA